MCLHAPVLCHVFFLHGSIERMAAVATTLTTATTPTTTTAEAGTSDETIATTAFVYASRPGGIYQTVTRGAGHLTAGQMANTYALPHGGQKCLGVSSGAIHPIVLLYVNSTLYPTVNNLPPLFCIRPTCCTNDVWSSSTTVTVGLYPVTRPESSGGDGITKYTFGTVVTDTECSFTEMDPDSLNYAESTSVELPAGIYAIGLVLGGTISLPPDSHAHITCDIATHYNEE